jgi:hypothetical protein
MSSLATRYQWSSTSGSASPITTTSAVTVQAAPAASTTNANPPSGSQIALTDLELCNSSTTACNINVVANSVVLATFYLPAGPANTNASTVVANFTTPIQCGRGNALTLVSTANSVNVYWNARGFTFNS